MSYIAGDNHRQSCKTRDETLTLLTLEFSNDAPCCVVNLAVSRASDPEPLT